MMVSQHWLELICYLLLAQSLILIVIFIFTGEVAEYTKQKRKQERTAERLRRASDKSNESGV